MSGLTRVHPSFFLLLQLGMDARSPGFDPGLGTLVLGGHGRELLLIVSFCREVSCQCLCASLSASLY